MNWRVARSLDTLLHQLDAQYPNRSKASDGSIGDANHLAEGWTDSDHNPWYPQPGGGIVTARDYTHDPADGVDIGRLSDELAASRDPRIKYIIANSLILDSRPQFSPWKWVPYHGSNPHDHHLHLSVMDNGSCDDGRPWDLPMLGGTGHQPPSAQGGEIAEGQTGERVRRLQIGLNQVFPRYSHLIADGVYGPETVKVVAQFQVNSGIHGGDGRNIGPQTTAALAKYGIRP